ncbi:DUF1775 domain-containing protein [Promicromonospora sp. MS192]|uniref:DUF1775 domain-containing protein n=1 Tax=Promicromonospora sp. MS192 TaxID=3412684 RepID=UPI003C2FDADD
MNRTTVVRRVALSGLAAAGLVALGATSAAAHVTVTPSTTAAGATAVLAVEIPHGCEGSATTALSLRMPDEVTEVTATDTDRWTVDQDADGLTYTAAAPLPDGAHDEVEFSVRLPDDAGATLVFPVVQRCEQGEAAWTEVAGHGEDHDALDRPAPVVVVTAGEGGAASPGVDPDGDPEEAGPAATTAPGTTEDQSGTATEAPTASEAPTATEAPTGVEAMSPVAGPEEASTAVAGGDPGGPDPLVTFGGGAVLLAGVVAGAVALLRHRRRP